MTSQRHFTIFRMISLQFPCISTAKNGFVVVRLVPESQDYEMRSRKGGKRGEIKMP